jgi:Phage protein (N4 Gp49/phage Sf6 gene 66) family
MIKPTVGRVVWFTPAVCDDPRHDVKQPLAAIIAYVYGDRCVNLTTYDQNGAYIGGKCSVLLLQDDDPKPEQGYFASWMPYQKGQAAATERMAAALETLASPPAPAARGISDDQVEEEIKDKGLTAPRVTPEHLDSVILSEQYHVFEGSQLTVCCLTLKNGFTVTGESACASPANFNAELGQKIARQKARDKIWALEGYLLRQRLHDEQFARQV